MKHERALMNFKGGAHPQTINTEKEIDSVKRCQWKFTDSSAIDKVHTLEMSLKLNK